MGLHGQQLASVVKAPRGYHDPVQQEKTALSGVIFSLESQHNVRFNFNSQLIRNKFVDAELVDKLARKKLDNVLDELLPPLSLAYEKISR